MGSDGKIRLRKHDIFLDQQRMQFIFVKILQIQMLEIKLRHWTYFFTKLQMLKLQRKVLCSLQGSIVCQLCPIEIDAVVGLLVLSAPNTEL